MSAPAAPHPEADPPEPRSHPDALSLLLFNTGRLGPVFRAAVMAHAAGCLRCGALLRLGSTAGGAFLATLPPTPLSPTALDAALARLDEAAPPSVSLPALLARRTWPVAPAVRHARLLGEGCESLHLFRVRPGAALPRHDHGGPELTCVLEGAVQDETGTYEAGDARPKRPGAPHEPVAVGDRDCVCLLATAGRLRFATSIPSLVQKVMGL